MLFLLPVVSILSRLFVRSWQASAMRIQKTIKLKAADGSCVCGSTQVGKVPVGVREELGDVWARWSPLVVERTLTPESSVIRFNSTRGEKLTV